MLKSWIAVTVLVVLPAWLAIGASPVAIRLLRQDPAPIRGDDDDDAAYEAALAERVFVENCLMCHDSAMVSRQRFSREQWAAEVAKMVGWGAPVAEAEVDGLVSYLAAAFPADSPPAPLPRLLFTEINEYERPPLPSPDTSDADLEAGARLFGLHCAGCHGADARGGEVGTNLVQASSLVSESDYRDLLRTGLRKMPSFAEALDEDDERATLAWLRGLRYPAE